jgi:hypothetical protein
MKQNLIAAILIGVVLVNTAGAAPSPPPNQTDWEAAIAASCGASKEIAQGEPIRVTANPIPVNDIGGKDHIGRLQYLWGARLSSPDKRFGGIAAVALDDLFGVLAVTDQGNWIAIDFQPEKIRSVHIAPMAGVSGKPAAILKNLTYYVSFSDRAGVTRFDIPACGLNAKSVPVTETNVPVTSMANVAYGYSLFAGRSTSTGALVDTVKDVNSLKRSEKMVLEPAADVPVLSGFELAGMSGPARIVPYNLISLWRPSGNNKETVIRSFNLPKWNDVRPSPDFPPETVADIPVPLAAVAGAYSFEDSAFYIVAATHSSSGEPTAILFFSWKPEHS